MDKISLPHSFQIAGPAAASSVSFMNMYFPSQSLRLAAAIAGIYLAYGEEMCKTLFWYTTNIERFLMTILVDNKLNLRPKARVRLSLFFSSSFFRNLNFFLSYRWVYWVNKRLCFDKGKQTLSRQIINLSLCNLNICRVSHLKLLRLRLPPR